jgi:hypothetical protein
VGYQGFATFATLYVRQSMSANDPSVWGSALVLSEGDDAFDSYTWFDLAPYNGIVAGAWGVNNTLDQTYVIEAGYSIEDPPVSFGSRTDRATPCTPFGSMDPMS